VTPEIAVTRGVRPGEDCVSPARHGEFATPIELLQFVERLRKLSGGKPTGFKLCIGHPWEWFAICKAMLETGLTPDFIVVDGSEGGTGAAPLEFVDHVGTPLQEGLLLVHNTLVGLNLRHRIKLGCSGKIISAFDIARALALGADWCNSARGFMFALGCLQAQTCHTGACPTGVATQDPLRQRALAVPDKAERVYRFHHHTMAALRELAQAAGLKHPNEFRAAHLVRRVPDNDVRLLSNVLPQMSPGLLLEAAAGRTKWPHRVFALYWPQADSRSFAPLRVQAASSAVDVERVVHESAA
jgi:glutamate synthase domain-containing protein 2